METPNLLTFSALPHELLRSIFERLSFADFHRAKIVCSTWNSISKQTVSKKIRSPWLILFPEGEDGCVLYNPEEDMIYKTERDFSGIRFFANYANWFLVIDSKSNLYIIDVFSENMIDLPPLERLGDKKFKWQVTNHHQGLILNYPTPEDLTGLLWVDEKTKEFVAVWFIEDSCNFIAYCKKGDDHYSHIELRILFPNPFQRVSDIVLHGYFLYIAMTRMYHIQILDLSNQKGFDYVPGNYSFKMFPGWGSPGKTLI